MKQENLMTLQEHFAELRQRVIFSVVFFVITFCFCYFFSEKIYEVLLQPFAKIIENNNHHKLIYTSPTEAFTTYLKLSLISSLFFSFPIFFAEFFLFLSPALYKKEKKNILFSFFLAAFLFLFGAIFAYYFILPLALKFFLSFENIGSSSSYIIPIQLETKISEYLSFVSNLVFGFGVAFELPMLLLFFMRVGLLSRDGLRKKRRYWIVIIFILSAILTPPDLLSQIILALLLILLFEIALLISKNFDKKKTSRN